MNADQGVSTASPHVSGSPTIPTPPGSFYLSTIPGWVGRTVSAAQAFARGGSLWTHAGIYVGNGRVVQAEPGGVKVRNLPDKLAADPLLWSDAPIERHLATPGKWIRQDGYETHVRKMVTEAALALVDAPYAWLDYLTIAAAEWGIPGWERLRARVDGGGRYLCSSLVDRAYAMAGVHLFTDNRPPGQVTPGDLARYDEAWVRLRLADLERRMTDVEKRLP